MKLHVLIGLVFLLVLGVVLHERPAEAKVVPKVVRAQMIELVDGRGVRRASLKVEPQGAVVFRLFDETGTIRVKLGAGESGSGSSWQARRPSPACTSSRRESGPGWRFSGASSATC